MARQTDGQTDTTDNRTDGHVSMITAFIRTERTDMARSTPIVILIKNIILYGVGNAPFYLLHTFTFHSKSNGYKSVEQFQEVLKQGRVGVVSPKVRSTISL